MPQFHFRQTGDDPDRLGDSIELPDLDAARAEAVRFLAETIRFRPDTGGITTLAGIAAALNDRGITTPRGQAWAPVQVSRVHAATNG